MVDYSETVVCYNSVEAHPGTLVDSDLLAWLVFDLQVCGLAAMLQQVEPSECTGIEDGGFGLRMCDWDTLGGWKYSQ